MIRKRMIASITVRLMTVSVSAAVIFAVSVSGASAATSAAPAQELPSAASSQQTLQSAGSAGASAGAAAGAASSSAGSQATEKTAAPSKVAVIDTDKPDELRKPVNALKENVLSYDLVTKGTPYDAAGLLTYRIENGQATIMSCDPAVTGELYIPDVINGCPVTAVNDYAFMYCANLTAVTLPATVTDIGDYAFCYCTHLASVAVSGSSAGALTIGDHAFYRCYDLKKLDCGVIKEMQNYAFAYSGISVGAFAEGLELIGAYAFEGCSGLVQMTLPDSVRTVGDFAFYDCAALTHVTFPSALADAGTGGYIFYKCSALRDITPSGAWTRVPDGIFAECGAVDPYCVLKEGMTEIGHGAFYYCSGIKKDLVIPSTVKRIEAQAFNGAGCEYGKGRSGANGGVDSVSFPEGLKYIGAGAFQTAVFADGLKLPDSVREIGAGAFKSCGITGTLRLPSSLEKTGKEAFAGNMITEAEIHAGLKTVGDQSFYGNSQLLKVTIDSGSDVSGWGVDVFGECTALTDVKLPSSWRSIPEGMFTNCSALVSIDIPSGVTEIGKRAFNGCHALKNAVIPSGMKTISQHAFAGAALESITLPSGLEKIDPYAFYGTKITSLIVPSSVESIGEKAFSACTELKTVRISAGKLQELGDSAFSGCSSLKSVEIGSGLEKMETEVFRSCRALESVALPSTLKYIGETTNYFKPNVIGSKSSCFADCVSLSSITLPEGLVTIGDSTFANCSALKEIRLPASLEYLGSGAFKGSGLESVTLADGIKQSGAVSASWVTTPAFDGCKSLKHINIPSSWTSIPAGFLKGCSGPLEVTIPYGITEIGQSAFENCTGFKAVSIPSTVTKIGKKAFYNCGFESLVIPDSVPQDGLGEYAIGGCKSLKDVKLPSSWTKLPDGLFQNNVSISEYTVADNFTEIGKGAFSGSALRNIILPESITAIDDEAFKGCKQLAAARLPSKLEKLGESAFDGCSSLTEIVVPGSVKEISPLAFASCSSLKRAVVESGVESIASLAFGYCDVLSEVVVPDSVVKIGYCAFYGSDPGVLTLVCSEGSEADKHAAAVLYLNSTHHKLPEGLKVVELYSRELFDTEGILFHGAYYYDVEYKGIRYRIEYAGGNSNGWRKNYSREFKAMVYGPADSVKNSYSVAEVTIDAYIAGSSVPVTSIKADAFSGLDSIKKVKLGANISTIGNRAFGNCKSLTSVDMGQSSIKSLGGAFEGCTSLTDIIWPKVMETIEKEAFRGCTSLKKVDLSGTVVKKIYQRAFYGCSSLSELKLREGFQWIDDEAFSGTAIKNAYLPASLEILQPTAFDSKKTSYHFTGDATKVNYYWTDDQLVTHYDPVLPLILEDRGSTVGQFFGKGLDGQSTYWISTSTAGLNVPYGMQSASVVFGEMGVPIGDTASEADGDLSAQASGDSIPDSIDPAQPEAEEAEKDETEETVSEKVYEVVKNRVSENPWMLGIAGLIAAALASLGGFRRYRRNK